MHMSEITIAYGMTETSPVSFQSSRDDPLELRVSTVGRIQPHLEVKIVDRDGRIVPRGEAGELCTRGYSVMLGYWNDEARTREAIDSAGWMHTGDLATIDDDGYCRIVGRIKDMVIRGGENIYPREVEEYLYRHPDIQDVQVFGVPDTKYGEELCAWIVAKAGATLDEEGVRRFCQDRISHYKIPRHIRFVESFPSTVTGKVQKFAMREAMIEEFAPRRSRDMKFWASDMEAFEYSALPARVIFGFGTLPRVADEMAALGRKRAFVLSGSSSRSRRLRRGSWMRLASWVSIFRPTRSCTRRPMSPKRVMAKLVACNADCLVSLGGGSTIGLGKGAGAPDRPPADRASDHLCRLRGDPGPWRD